MGSPAEDHNSKYTRAQPLSAKWKSEEKMIISSQTTGVGRFLGVAVFLAGVFFTAAFLGGAVDFAGPFVMRPDLVLPSTFSVSTIAGAYSKNISH